jgi:hypothetical protein
MRASAVLLHSSILLLACVTGLRAQQETGSITGQLIDATGAAVPKAVVVTRNDSTAASFQTATDESGFYRAPNLGPGIYSITATAPGFRTLVREGIVVRVNDRLRIDLNMEVGVVSEKVTVETTTPLLQTEDAATGQVIDNQRIVELPLNGRNWLQLATLAPATATYPGSVDSSGGNSQNVMMNLGGTRTSQNNYLLDGADHTNFIGGGALVFPPVDSLQEFKVQTNNYTADTGRLGAAVINATIKSGSNGFHGTAYEFLRNRSLNARNYFSLPNVARPEFTRNQFGASLGGPFIRSKLFFFLNYEGNRQRQDQVVTTTVFTDAQKAGDFSSALGRTLGTDPLGRPVAQGQLFDPFSVQHLPNGGAVRDPFPGNIIPVSRMNPVSKTLIDLAPRPNTAGSPNFVRNLGNPLNIDTFVGRVDWNRSQKNTVFGHFFYADQNTYTAPILGVPLDGGNAVNYRISNQRQLVLGWTHIFTPTNLNDLRVSYVRNATPVHTVQADQDLNAKFGIPLPSPTPLVGGLASMMIAGYSALGTNVNVNPQFINKYELSDAFTAIRGPHTLKFGFRAAVKNFENQANSSQARGVLTFDGVFTGQVGTGGTGSSVADFLMGTMDSAALSSVANELDVAHDIEWYAQDQWRASSKLTVTLGVRHQYIPPDWEARDRISSVIFGRNFINPQIVVPKAMSEADFSLMKDVLFPFISVVRGTDLDRGLVRNTYRNFAPRLGIAYQLGPKTVVRSGYGIFYGFSDVVSGTVLTINPPSKISITQNSNTIDPTLIIDKSVFGSNPFQRQLTNPSFYAVRAATFPPDFIQMYNLSVQLEFAPNWLVEVGFLGNRSSRVAVVTQINDAYPAVPSDTSSLQSRRRVSTVLGNLPYFAPRGYSNYNAMTLSLEKRFSGGLSLIANYTWSRALGVAPAITQGINTAPVQNPYDLKREYGPLEFDIINRVSIASVYELPFGKGERFLSHARGAANYLVQGWQVNGIFTVQGGFPITPVLSYSLGKTATNSRPDAIGDPNQTSRQPSNWINPAAFAAPSNAAIAAGTFFGNAGRGSIREPGLTNLDLSLSKNMPIREHMRLQFRAEFFNTTNTPNFALASAVGTTFGSPTFGKVTAAGDPRVIQFGLKLAF